MSIKPLNEEVSTLKKFILDGMLGSLTRWLRISGYDALYYKDTDDDELINEALKEHRILLTRDKELVIKARKKEVEAYFIDGISTLEKLTDLRKKTGLIYSLQNSRCPRCNGKVVKVGKEDVYNQVPEASYNAFNNFWKCDDCDAIYWKGSHWERLKLTLKKANKT
jgi:hypothetical protein